MVQDPSVAILAFEWFRQRKPGNFRHRNDQSLILSRIKIDNLSSGNIHGVEKASPSDDVGSQTCLGFWDIRVEIRLKGPR